MKSIVRFLCVIIMLQVATPLVHGMDVELGDKNKDAEAQDNGETESLLGNTVGKFGRDISKRLLKLSYLTRRYIKKNWKAYGVGLLTCLGVGGILAVALSERVDNSYYPHGRCFDTPECEPIPWNGLCRNCEYRDDQGHMLMECQQKLLSKRNKSSCFPYCLREEVPDSSGSFLLEDFSGEPDVQKGGCISWDGPSSYVFCLPEDAATLGESLKRKEIEYCIVVNGAWGWVAVSPRDQGALLDDEEYLTVGSHPELLEECNTASIRERTCCTGPLISNATGSTCPTKKRKKRKRRT